MTSASAPEAIRRCPICKSAAVVTYRPFCSKRCADIDLGKWFAESYAIAGDDEERDGDIAPQTRPDDDAGDA